MERRQTSTSLTRRAIASIDNGDLAEARRILGEALDLAPDYKPAWQWLAAACDDDGERKYCLEKLIELDPSSPARSTLLRLRDVAATVPADIADLEEPPAPSILALERGAAIHRRLRWWGWLLGAAVVAVLIGGGIWTFRHMTGGERSPIYVALVAAGKDTPRSSGQRRMQNAQLYLDTVNRGGGVGGHPVRLLVYDDGDDPARAAAVAGQIVADGRAVAVIGHGASDASLAAAPIYAAARVPAISGTSTADGLTAGSSWYFRSIYSNALEGAFLATYASSVLHYGAAAIVSDDGAYGTTLGDGFAANFSAVGRIDGRFVIPLAADARLAAVAQMLAGIAALGPNDPLFLALPSDVARDVVVVLRGSGIANPILGGDTMGSDAFLAGVGAAIPPTADLARYTDGLHAASPILGDGVSGNILRWHQTVRDAFGYTPDWQAAKTVEAAMYLVDAMRTSGATGDAGARAAERGAIRDALRGHDSRATALQGLTGPLYFDATGSTVSQVSIGVASGDRFASAPMQLLPARAGTGAGTNGFDTQRVVFIGFNVNSLSGLDTKASFHADFFVWLRYAGDDAVTNLTFTNAVYDGLTLGDPIREEASDGLTYRLYRVDAAFRSDPDFHDFPFDRQQLPISVQNRELPAANVNYVADRSFVDQPQRTRLASGLDGGETIGRIPNWRPVRLESFRGTSGATANLGDPKEAAGAGGVEYSEFTVQTEIRRDLRSFLVKNLLPLALLVLVTYISLFFSASQSRARVSFGISGILTGAVLLSGVTGVLPEVGYTVAIEWGFYAFLLLSATCILIGLVSDRMYEDKHYASLGRLMLASRLYYPLYVAAVVADYVWAYR